MYRGSRGMSFVRGESSDTEQKGDKYLWAAPQPATTGTFANRSKRARDDDDYFDEPDDAPPSIAAAASVDADDPLEAYMAGFSGSYAAWSDGWRKELEAVSGLTVVNPAFTPISVRLRPAPTLGDYSPDRMTKASWQLESFANGMHLAALSDTEETAFDLSLSYMHSGFASSSTMWRWSCARSPPRRSRPSA